MANLKDFAITAHGGLERWNGLTTASAHLHIAGMRWPLKGQDGVQDDIDVRVELHRQFTSHFPFTRPGLRTAFTATRVAIETDAGEVVEERANPRESFAGHPRDAVGQVAARRQRLEFGRRAVGCRTPSRSWRSAHSGVVASWVTGAPDPSREPRPAAVV
jgi:hypothetical protein